MAEREPAKRASWLDRLGRLRFGDIASGLVISGIIVYAVFAQSYRDFYAKLEVTPEQVGVGYQQILERSALGFVIIVAVLLYAGSLAYFGLYSLERYLESHPDLLSRLPTKYPMGLIRRFPIPWFLFLVLLLGYIGFQLLGGAVDAQATAVQRGQSVEGVSVVDVTVMVVGAHAVRVRQLNGTVPPGVDACMMDLGEKDAVEVFYNIHTRTAVRIPTASIVVVSMKGDLKGVC